MGYHFLANSPTNQVFPIFSNEEIEQLQQHFSFYVWEKVDEHHSAIRLITSWATSKEAVLEFLKVVNKIKENQVLLHV